MLDIENPMVIDRPTIPQTQVYTVEVTAKVTATIKVKADNEEEIDGKIDGYTDDVIDNMNNLEIDGWEIISFEDAEAEDYD